MNKMVPAGCCVTVLVLCVSLSVWPRASIPSGTQAVGSNLFLKYDGVSTMRLFGIAFGRDDSMYVVGGDAAVVGTDGYVSKVTPAGKEKRFVDFKSIFVGPGVDIDADNNLYIAGGDKIIRIANDGRISVLMSGFSGAFDIRLDPKRNMYVSDHREGRIYRITPALDKTVLVDYHLPPGAFILGGLAFDKDYRHLYSYQTTKKTLWRYSITATGSIGASETVLANAPALFSFELDGNGNVMGADFDKGEIVRIDKNGKVTYITDHCGLKHAIGFRLGKKGFHPHTAFVADAEGIKQVALPENSY